MKATSILAALAREMGAAAPAISRKCALAIAAGMLCLPLVRAESPDLLPNGNLKKGMEGWKASVLRTAVGEVKLNSDGPGDGVPALQVSVTSAGETLWDVNLQLTGFAVEQGKSYTFTFSARSEPGVDLDFMVLIDGGPEKALAQQKRIAIREDWEEYAFHFVAEASAPQARIYVGGMNRPDTTFWFANASLRVEE